MESLSQEQGAGQSLAGALSAFSCPAAACHVPCDSVRHRMGSQGQRRVGATGEQLQLKDHNSAWRECGSAGEGMGAGVLLGRF